MREFFVSLDTISPLLAFLAGILLFRNAFMPREIKWLQLYLLCSFLFNGAGNVLSEFYEINNHFLYHIQNQLNLIILSFYFIQLPLLAKHSLVIILTGILFTIANVSWKLSSGNYTIFDSFGFAWSSVIFTIYCLLYYAALLHSQKGENLFSIPTFWFVTGILIYYACCFFIFILYRHYSMLGNTGLLWRFQNVMLMIMSIFIAKGFVCQASHKSPSL